MNRCAGGLAVILSLAAHAALAWEASEDFRGLQLYSVTDGPITLNLVCDPNGAFQPPSNHLAIKKADAGLDGPYRLTSEAASYEGILVGGTDISTGNKHWPDLIAVLKSGETLTLSLNGQDFDLDTASAFSATCGSE